MCWPQRTIHLCSCTAVFTSKHAHFSSRCPTLLYFFVCFYLVQDCIKRIVSHDEISWSFFVILYFTNCKGNFFSGRVPKTIIFISTYRCHEIVVWLRHRILLGLGHLFRNMFELIFVLLINQCVFSGRYIQILNVFCIFFSSIIISISWQLWRRRC